MKTNRSLVARCAALCCLVLLALPAFGQYARNRYALFLTDPPVVQRVGSQERLGAPDAVTYRRQVESRQRSVMDALTARQIRVTGSVSVLLNAVFVTAEPGRVAEMAALPGVAGVVPMRRGKMDLNTAINLVNAPAAWALSAIGGQANAGKGVKVGIIDTGIDNTHAAFQDSTLSYPTGFPICTIGSLTPGGAPQNCSNPSLYTNTKVTRHRGAPGAPGRAPAPRRGRPLPGARHPPPARPRPPPRGPGARHGGARGPAARRDRAAGRARAGARDPAPAREVKVSVVATAAPADPGAPAPDADGAPPPLVGDLRPLRGRTPYTTFGDLFARGVRRRERPPSSPRWRAPQRGPTEENGPAMATPTTD